MVKKISRDTTIAELVQSDPEAAETLRSKGLGCTHCPMAQFETIEMGARGHGMDPDEIINELNRKREEFEASAEADKKVDSSKGDNSKAEEH